MKPTRFLIVFLALVPGYPAHGATPEAVYIHEGFNGTGIPVGWNQVRLSGVQASWSLVGTGSNPTVPPYAGTGQAKFNSFDAAVGEQARLTTPVINLSSSTDPFLTFWMYHDDEYLSAFDSLYVEASTTDSVSGPWTTLAGVRRPRTENRWIKEVISLYPYRGANRLFLSLRGVSKYGNNIFVDEFRVADSSFHDIGTNGLLFNGPQLQAQQSPSPRSEATSSRIVSGKSERTEDISPSIIRVGADSPLNIGAIIRNYGTFTENSYSVSWRIDLQQQTPVAGRPIAARIGRDTLTLTWSTPVAGVHSLTAWTVLSTDSTRTNDTTRLTFQVLDTATVFYESFNGSAFPPPNWVVINRDGGALAPWFRGADTSAFVPFEGSGFAANNFQRANSGYLDDYLISPPITGVGQVGRVDSLVFWARSMNNPPPAINFPDSLMILLSTGGTDTSSFTTLLDYFAVPKSGWTRKAYRLTGRVPTNSTVRVAFRYLLYNVLPTSGSGDFIGVDAVQVVRPLPTAVGDRVQTPTSFALEQNYPNPFNPTTEIRFQISVQRTPYGEVRGQRSEVSHMTLKVFDVLGREVATLVNEEMKTGNYETTFNAAGLSSGVYFYRLTTSGATLTKRMLLLR